MGLVVFVAAEILHGVDLEGFEWALMVAITLSILNSFVKPVLIFLIIPATLVKLGLFLFVIKACIVLMAVGYR
jgi:putative membrane protein